MKSARNAFAVPARRSRPTVPLTTQHLDTGFRVLKLDSTNMEDVYYAPEDTDQRNLFNMVDNVKPDRTSEDLLFQVMLELGATLDSKIETTTVGGKTIYNVADNFTQEKHTTVDKAFEGKKSIVDYVFTDSDVEKRFVGKIDTAKEVAVYAKLPKGFHIPTPVGNYSPDWAIAFQEGAVKHIYFVAETKGSMSSMDITPLEQRKIDCAGKLFKQLSTANVTYGKVDSFETLMNLVN